ncbi:MAG: penicillin-binding protein activator [Micavibrio sp.]|nr:penicillin-binding protein activator [Micavibrio sp.]|tara:strand:+ start:606 stop:1907 length:1302 start_codon:yes stop_codon:yes gene_type:complete
MKRFQFLFCSLLLSATLLLQACAGSNYTNGKTWQYKPAPAKQAQAEPANLDTSLPPENGRGELETESEAAILSQAKENLPPVKVAILLPLSGQHETLGQAMLNAAQMALFEVGHNAFELMPRDTKGNASGAAEAARNAVQNGAQLVLGPLFSNSVRAAKPITRGAGVNMVAFSTDWTLADNSTFMMGFLPFDQVSRVVDFAVSQGIRNVGVFSPATDYGDTIIGAYNNISYQAGLNTVATKRFAPNTSRLSSDMRAFSDYDARKDTDAPPPMDAIFMPVGGEMARTVASVASQYNMRPDQVRRLGTGLWDDENLASEPALQGAWFAAPSPSLRKGFERRYFEIYAISPPRLTSLAYDATALAAILARNGLKTTGRPSFDSVSIENPNGFAGIDGIFRFREGGLVERGLAVLEFRNGTMRVIDEAPRSFQATRM